VGLIEPSPTLVGLEAPNSLGPQPAWASVIDAAAEIGGDKLSHWDAHPSGRDGPGLHLSSHHTFSSYTYGKVIDR
jgi:hypothetical protein